MFKNGLFSRFRGCRELDVTFFGGERGSLFCLPQTKMVESFVWFAIWCLSLWWPLFQSEYAAIPKKHQKSRLISFWFCIILWLCLTKQLLFGQSSYYLLAATGRIKKSLGAVRVFHTRKWKRCPRSGMCLLKIYSSKLSKILHPWKETRKCNPSCVLWGPRVDVWWVSLILTVWLAVLFWLL